MTITELCMGCRARTTAPTTSQMPPNFGFLLVFYMKQQEKKVLKKCSEARNRIVCRQIGKQGRPVSGGSYFLFLSFFPLLLPPSLWYPMLSCGGAISCCVERKSLFLRMEGGKSGWWEKGRNRGCFTASQRRTPALIWPQDWSWPGAQASRTWPRGSEWNATT